MNNPIITGGHPFAIPSLKNNNVATLQAYKVIPFAENGSDAACVARIIEIHTLNKLREEGETLFSLIGLTVPDTEAVAEEINALVARCVKICRWEEDEFSFRQREAAEALAVMNQASGKSNTVSEARTRRGCSMAREDAERRYQAALTYQTRQQSRLELARALPGLLSAEAQYIGNQFSRFADWHDERNRPAAMMGFRKVDKGGNDSEPVTTFYVLPSGWKEICKGFDARKVARLCVAAGWLEPGSEGRTQTNVRLPEIGLKRVYQFNSQVLGSADPV